jgi:uncharacterized membrane protein
MGIIIFGFIMITLLGVLAVCAKVMDEQGSLHILLVVLIAMALLMAAITADMNCKYDLLRHVVLEQVEES